MPTYIYIYYYYRRREKQSKNYVDKHLLVAASALAADVITPKLVIDSFKPPNTTLFRISRFIALGDGGDGNISGAVSLVEEMENKGYQPNALVGRY